MMSISMELQITRSVNSSDKLALFFKSQTRWELLLLVAGNKHNEEIGIWNYIDMLETRTESQMTIYNFIKARIDDGSFMLLPGRKKSLKVIALSAEIRDSLNEYMFIRYQQVHLSLPSRMIT